MLAQSASEDAAAKNETSSKSRSAAATPLTPVKGSRSRLVSADGVAVDVLSNGETIDIIQPQIQHEENAIDGALEVATEETRFTDDEMLGSRAITEDTSIAISNSAINERIYIESVAEKRVIQRIVLTDKSQAAPSYLTLSPKEERVLKYVENFRRQYTMLYPNRKELLLTPPNEFGVRKFISTWIRPTQLPINQLYDYRSCARFVADFILYEPLDPPYDLPAMIPSPTHTLTMQLGNSFDMSILLTSLLRGVGYDAYVVSGYASRQITLMDETNVEMNVQKILSDWDIADIDSPAFASATAACFTAKTSAGTHESNKDNSRARLTTDVNPITSPKYKVKQKPPLKSKFIAMMEAKAKAAEEPKQELVKSSLPKHISKTNTNDSTYNGDDSGHDNEEDGDEMMGLRVHAWVLLLPGKREIAEPFFIEPSTGRVYDVDNEHYLGVESVFSSVNYWVNMQPCINGLKDVSFDLGDNAKWEFIFLENSQPSMSQGNRDPNDLSGGNGDLQEEDEDLAKNIKENTTGAADTGAGGSAGRPHHSAGPGSMGSGGGTGANGGNASGTNDSFDIPRSWVSPISISPAQFQSRCPSGSKTVTYRNAKLELFAPYHRPDGMVTRLTIFRDNTCNQYGEIREWYDNRRDKLLQRVRVPQLHLIHEYFDRGRLHALAAHTITKGRTTEVLFYEGARSDGLVRRQELERKTIEDFVDREDRLSYRSVTYEHHREVDETGHAVMHAVIIKMAEKFLRDPALPALQDMAKRTYFVHDERIRIVCHLPEDRLILSWREFRKPSTEQKTSFLELMTSFDADPISALRKFGTSAAATTARGQAEDSQSGIDTSATTATMIKKQHLYAKLCELLKAEQACLQAVKASDREIKEILTARQTEEKDIQLSISLYDTIRNQTDVTAEKDKSQQKSSEDNAKVTSVDYLSPFILSIVSQPIATGVTSSARPTSSFSKNRGAGTTVSPVSSAAAITSGSANSTTAPSGSFLTMADALAIRDAALKTFKERLIEKANIIQRRYDEETAAYQKRQQQYNRNAETMTNEETEEYVQFCNDALFRIHVLEKRLNRHKESAPEKFMALEKKLRIDPRLAKFLRDAKP